MYIPALYGMSVNYSGYALYDECTYQSYSIYSSYIRTNGSISYGANRVKLGQFVSYTEAVLLYTFKDLCCVTISTYIIL